MSEVLRLQMPSGPTGMTPGLSEQAPGTVSLVGAGPGDPELLTPRAWRRLQMAEVLVYDNLDGPGVVDFVPPVAERIYVGKSAGNHTSPQEAICQFLVDKARSGKPVVLPEGSLRPGAVRRVFLSPAIHRAASLQNLPENNMGVPVKAEIHSFIEGLPLHTLPGSNPRYCPVIGCTLWISPYVSLHTLQNRPC